MRARFAGISVGILIAGWAVSAMAQAVAPTLEDRLAALELRVEQLEQENRQLRAEVKQIATPLAEPVLVAFTSPEAVPLANVVATSRVALQAGAAPPSKPAAPEKKLPGLEVGPWRVAPYGTVHLNFYSNSGGANNADNPLFGASGHGNMSATLRQSRLGLRLDGPQVHGGKLSGVIETDFHGGLPGVGLGETFPLLRLRVAFARLQWEKTSLVMGQDWMVFSPNNPVSITSAAIPQFAAAGNLWQRLPQIRLERKGGNAVRWLGQAAMVVSGTGDFPSSSSFVFLTQPGTGSRARTPHFQARLSAAGDNFAGLGQSATIGLSGNYGRGRILTVAGDQEADVFGAALDWSLPVAPRLTFAGEAFFGRNLAGFQGGVFQGISEGFILGPGGSVAPSGPLRIGTRGGWAQLGFTPPGQDKLTFYASFGLDDPRNLDLLRAPARDWRERNQAYALSFLHKLSGQITWGLEYRRLETEYLQTGRRSNNHVNLGITTSF